MQDATLLVVRRPGSGFPVKQKEPPNVAVDGKRVRAGQQPSRGLENLRADLSEGWTPCQLWDGSGVSRAGSRGTGELFPVTPVASLNPIL